MCGSYGFVDEDKMVENVDRVMLFCVDEFEENVDFGEMLSVFEEFGDFW